MMVCSVGRRRGQGGGLGGRGVRGAGRHQTSLSVSLTAHPDSTTPAGDGGCRGVGRVLWGRWGRSLEAGRGEGRGGGDVGFNFDMSPCHVAITKHVIIT